MPTFCHWYVYVNLDHPILQFYNLLGKNAFPKHGMKKKILAGVCTQPLSIMSNAAFSDILYHIIFYDILFSFFYCRSAETSSYIQLGSTGNFILG